MPSPEDIIRDRHKNPHYKEWQRKNKVIGTDPKIVTLPSNDAYREGWDRIWGKKDDV